jgi:hypothetical protein
LLVVTVVLAAAAVSLAAGAAGATGTPSSGTNVLVVAAIEFLPADVTDFILKDAATRCTTLTA